MGGRGRERVGTVTPQTCVKFRRGWMEVLERILVAGERENLVGHPKCNGDLSLGHQAKANS